MDLLNILHFSKDIHRIIGNEKSHVHVFDNTVNAHTYCENFNLVEYLLDQNEETKEKLVRILKNDLKENDIDISNIEHYLIVATFANSTLTLICCENVLIQDLRPDNCNDYNKLAERYKLKRLKKEIRTFNHIKHCPISHPENLKPCQAPVFHRRIMEQPTLSEASAPSAGDIAIITYRRKSSSQSIKVIVCDKGMRVKCLKHLQFDEDKYKLLRCCSLACQDTSYLFMCFGKAFYRYKPLCDVLEKRASLTYKRTGYCLVTCSNRCYAIGGEHKGRAVYQIEEYENETDKWKKVATLPGGCSPLQPSCSVYKDSVYIFCAIKDRSNNIKKDITGVYVFYPDRQPVEKLPIEISFSFRQFKSCTLDSSIYIASDEGHFIRVSPGDRKVTQCKGQMTKCKTFGMLTREEAIILIGGVLKDGTHNNVARKYCTVSDTWEILAEGPPYNIPVYGVCEL